MGFGRLGRPNLLIRPTKELPVRTLILSTTVLVLTLVAALGAALFASGVRQPHYATVRVAALMASPAPYCHDGACHPVNPAGYVTDGSPQPSDQQCDGNADQVTACVDARRPQCLGYQMSRSQALACWAPAINAYAGIAAGHEVWPWSTPRWDASTLFNTLYCESRGKNNANNGAGDYGLLQETAGNYDPTHDMILAYHQYWLGQHGAAWPHTYGVYCPG